MTLADPARTGPYVAFKRHVRAVPVAEEAVYLLASGGATVLQGAGTRRFVSLLDGTRTLRELLREADATALPASEAGELVRRLARANLVGYRTRPHAQGPASGGAEEPPAGAGQPAAGYWDSAGLNGAEAARRVRGARVAVVALGDVDASAAADACRQAGLTPVRSPEGAALTLVLCHDYLAPVLHDLSARLRQDGRTWLLARPFGAELWTGPVFEPADGPCWECLAHRLRAHRRGELPLQHALGLGEPASAPECPLAPAGGVGLNAAVLEAVKWLAGYRYPGQREVLVLDSLTMSAGHHPVRRRPQCPRCGDATLMAEQARQPVALGPRPKARGTGSNHRALTPAQTLERYRHLVGAVTGVVPALRPLEGAFGLHRYDSGHNLALAGTTLAGMRQRLRAHSGGKGVTAQEAEAGALCEALERYSGTRQGDELAVRDTLEGLGASAVHPNRVQLFHERQYRDRESWNARHSVFQHVAPPFDARLPTDWTPVWSPAAGTHLMLPTSLLYFHAGPDAPPDGLYADSNGNAAGSSLEDALVQGFLELVERDAVALWWYNRTRQAAVDLDAFDAPWLGAMREEFARAGRSVWALDLTSDLGVPVFAAVSRRADADRQRVVFGFGAHLDPALALRRAMTEMAQLAPPAGWDPAGEAAAGGDRVLSEWWSHATTEDHPYLLPDPGQRAAAPGRWPYAPREDLFGDIEEIFSLVARHGLELLVLDQTRPDIRLPVVKVIVPGLRHFWTRFAPGRLFDVPVQLGRVSRPTRYEDLNPFPLFV